MANSFTAKEARDIINEHLYLKDNLQYTINLMQYYERQIEAISNEIVGREAFNIIKDIPVEEVNRDKKGIRVKSLKDAGYNSIADLHAATYYNLVDVNGISEESAGLIKQIVGEIVKEASKGVKLKISTDNKTDETTRLINCISRYRQMLTLAQISNEILKANVREIDYAIEELSAATNSIKWFFAGSSRKGRAEDAYGILSLLLNEGYGKDVNTVIRSVEKVQNQTNSQAWEDFSENSIQFINTLESLVPGLVGSDDTVYGLPEELAREIQDEAFFPEGLNCELRRYQEWGVKYILHQEKVLLGDEMGLGKTIQAIATMVSLKNTGASHFMVVCPASVITNWCREIKKHSKLSVIKIHGANREGELMDWINVGGVAVTTFETTAAIELSEDFEFSMLVVDEAHYIKNPEAARSKNVRSICKHADRLLFMTGTALENRVDEMISLVEVLRPEIASKIEKLAALSSAPQFREAVAPVYYRRKRNDVLTELPELTETREWCDLNSDENLAYETAILSRNYADARRVSWNVMDIEKSSKANRMLEIIEDAKADGRKVIVFSFFLDTIQKVSLLLGDNCLQPINGSVSPQRRQEIIDEFDKAMPGTVLAAQIQSGGTGLNIQSASVVILCEPQLKPSIENQAIARAYRMGQTRNVLVHRLLADDTIDEKIIDMLEEKQKIFDAFADESVAAEESLELDEKTLGNIIEEEIERIKNM